MKLLSRARTPHLRVAFFAIAGLLLGVDATASEPLLRAGLARAEITPTQPVTLSGYASRKDLSQGVHDPLWARAIAFEQDGRRLVLVAIDSIGFYGGTAAPLRQAILETAKLGPAELFLAATHDHSSPGLTLDPGRGHANNLAYTQALRDTLTKLVHDALERLQPVTLAIGSGSSPVGVNRREPVRDTTGNVKIKLGRNPAKLTDREVQVVKITTADTKTVVGALFAYPTHSTAMGARNYQVSGDVHGLAAQFVEGQLGRDVIVPAVVGASADIDPWFRVLPEFKSGNGWVPEAVLMGTMLGEEIVHVLGRAAPPKHSAPLHSIFRTLELPAKPRNRAGEPVSNATVSLNVTIARLGDVALVGLGAEVGNDIGAAIKAASPFPCTIVMTHCNGGAGYLVPESYYAEGGYEPETSPFAPPAAAQLLDNVVRLLREINAGSGR